MDNLVRGIVLPDWIALRSETHSEVSAVSSSIESLSYKQLEIEVSHAAGRLLSLIKKNSRPIASLTKNGVDFAIALHSTIRILRPLLPLNTRLTVNELIWQLRHAEVEYLLFDESNKVVAEQLAAICEIELIQISELRDKSSSPVSGSRAELLPTDPLAIVFTSGTTGNPKATVLSHRNFYWSAVASEANIGVSNNDRWLACMPLFHVGGLSILVRSAIYGTSVVIHENFNENLVNIALNSGDVTLLSVVPTMLERILSTQPTKLKYPDTIRAVLLGGGPATPELIRRGQLQGLPLLQTYGLTEVTSQVATVPISSAFERAGSAGLPLLAATVRLDRGDGAEPTLGEAGQILVKGATVTSGYLQENTAVSDKIKKGWLHTGDLAIRDDMEFLTIQGRSDDLIVTGGENVHPAEVEQIVESYPGVLEAAVVGLDDAEWGKKIASVVVVEANSTIVEEELTSYVRDHIAGYKVPRIWSISSDPLPRTASGKLKRYAVVEFLFNY
jgi:O-succinylbenzoic acid--CoA ligase